MYNVMVIKSRRMVWVGYVEHMEGTRNAYNFVTNLKQ